MARTYFIDSEEVKIDQGWSIEDKVNEKSVFDCTVLDLLNLSQIDNGDSFAIYHGAVKIYGGVVKDIEAFEEIPGKLYYNISVANNSAIAEKFLIGAAYENQTAGYIVRDLITQKLSLDSVTEGEVQDGPVISKAVFNYISVYAALDFLKDITGFAWEINSDLELNFYERATYTAPFNITDSSRIINGRHKKSMTRYKNVLYARGGDGRTSLQEGVIPTPKPDGKSRSFVLPYPVAEEPVIYIDTVQVSPATIGVTGFDTGKAWYFQYGSPIVTQDEGEVVLSDANDIDMDFVGLFPIFVEAKDESEIANRAVLEGNSGHYESLIVERSLNTIDSAAEYANSILRKYSEVADVFEFSTYTAGLTSGQIIDIDRTLYGISSTFLIESVIMEEYSGEDVMYTVRCIDGAALGGWEEFFRNIAKAGKDYVISENEVLIKLQAYTDTLTFTDTLTVSAAAPETRIGYATLGFGEIGA